MTNKTDMVNHPPHYNAYSIEVIEVTRHCSFVIGNAIKYMLRHLHKGSSKQDLEKALWYINDHIAYSHDGLPLVQGEEARANLRELIKEYSEQEGMIPQVGAALAFIGVNNSSLARTALEIALSDLA